MKNSFNNLIRKGVLLFFSFLYVSVLTSQSQGLKLYTPPVPKGFIMGGIGINDYGLGLGLELSMGNNLWFYGAGGLGTWGYKLTSGIKYYPWENAYGSSFSIGYSYASGNNNFVVDLDVQGSGTNTYEKTVVLDLNAITTLNLIYSYNIKLGRRSKLEFSGGYAFSLSKDFYTNKTSYYKLTKGSEDFIRDMAPGGVILGLKYLIGGV